MSDQALDPLLEKFLARNPTEAWRLARMNPEARAAAFERVLRFIKQASGDGREPSQETPQ